MDTRELTPLTEERCELALTAVAQWMGRRYFDIEQCPTGRKAAEHALGPVLVMDYEGCWYPQPPTPTILVEGIPGADWADWACAELEAELADLGIVSEPLNGFALSLHPRRERQVTHD